MKFRNPETSESRKLGRAGHLRVFLSAISARSLTIGSARAVLVLLSLSIMSCGEDKQEKSADQPKAAAWEAKKEEAWRKARDKRLARELAFEKEELARMEAEQKALGEQLIRELATLQSLRRVTERYNLGTEAQQTETVGEAPRGQTTPVKMTDEQKLAAYETHGITGVPAPEGTEIIRKAKLQGSPWRANYEIESEGKGYASVQDFAMKVAQMPTKVRDEIVNSAKREHAGDWSRISDEVTRQAEAWTTLEEWRKTTVPGLTRGEGAAALSAAINRWPGNWEMALRSVNDEVRKLAR